MSEQENDKVAQEALEAYERGEISFEQADGIITQNVKGVALYWAQLDLQCAADERGDKGFSA